MGSSLLLTLVAEWNKKGLGFIDWFGYMQTRHHRGGIGSKRKAIKMALIFVQGISCLERP